MDANTSKNTLQNRVNTALISTGWDNFYRVFFSEGITRELPFQPMMINTASVVPPLNEWHIRMIAHINLEKILEVFDHFSRYLPTCILNTRWNGHSHWPTLLEYELKHVRKPGLPCILEWSKPIEYRPAFQGNMLSPEFRQNTMTLPEFLIFQLFHRCMLGRFYSLGASQHFILLGTKQPGIGYPVVRIEQDAFWFGWMPDAMALEGYWAPQITLKP